MNGSSQGNKLKTSAVSMFFFVLINDLVWVFIESQSCQIERVQHACVFPINTQIYSCFRSPKSYQNC